MGWPLPLHVLIKITRECKTDFLNASCLFFSVFLAYLFLLLFLGGSRVGGGRYHNSCRVGEKEGWLSVVVAVAFSTPQRARLFGFFGHLPPFLSLFFSLAGLLGLGTERSMMGQCWDENGKWMMAEGRLTANSEKEEQNDEDRMYAR